jgi:competence protein ComEC
MIYADIFPASFIANPIAIPTVSLIVIPILFLGTFAILLSQEWGYLLLSKAILIFDSTFNFLAHYVLSDTTRHTWQPFVPSLWATLIAVIGITLLLLPRGFPGRWLGVIGLLSLFFSPTTQPLQSNEVELTLLDVGQGLASVIQTQYHTLVYDTGPKHDRFDQAIVLPFLRSQRVQQIDTLIISHLENDHYGGSATLLKNFVVKEVLTNFPQKAKSLGIIPTQPCQLGQQWQWDGVQFEILHPPSNYVANANDSSCVLKVSIGQYALLLPGDVGKLIEYRLVQQHQQRLQADILVAPHHGSRHSSSEVFIETVKPKLVLFSAGYRNNFNHPHPQTQKRYRSRGIQLLRTDFTGAVALRFSSEGLTKITLAREQKRRYWHDRIEFDSKSLLHNIRYRW